MPINYKRSCPTCKGEGKLPFGECNCGSGEGCTYHSNTALHMFGRDCPDCDGRGWVYDFINSPYGLDRPKE